MLKALEFGFPIFVVPRRPGRSRLPIELYYYSGDCTSNSTQRQIQENFIQILNQSNFRDLCSEYQECSAGNVQVRCGEISSGRRKRSSHTHQILVTFELSMKTDGVNFSSADIYTLEDPLIDLADAIKNEITDGKFDMTVPGFTVEIDVATFQYGYAELQCETGQVPNDLSLTCRKFFNDLKVI